MNCTAFDFLMMNWKQALPTQSKIPMKLGKNSGERSIWRNEPTLSKYINNSYCKNIKKKKHSMLNLLSLPPRNCTCGCFPEGGKISKGGNTCTVFPLFLPREFEFLCRKHTAAYWTHLLRGGKIRRLYYSYVEMGRNGMTTDDQNLKWKKPGAALTSICF